MKKNKRKLLAMPLIILLATILTSCRQVEDDIFTTAQIMLNAGDTIQIDRIQANALLTDLNSKRTMTTSDFDGNTLRVTLLRSAYAVAVEGIVRYRDTQNQVRMRQFRAHADYLSFASMGVNTAMLDIIFMEP